MDMFTGTYASNTDTVCSARDDVSALFKSHPAYDDVRLIVSELAANAAEHGTGATYTVTVTYIPDGDAAGIRVTVTNEGGAKFPPRKADLWRTRGRGLWIVQALAPSWGGSWGNDLTRVWFAFPEAVAQPALAAA